MDTPALFTDLDIAEPILKAITDLGFEQPSPIQEQAIPPGIEGRDVVGQSQTGSGKTMAFAIPVLQRIDPANTDTQALILCPTRELAMQVCQEVHKLSRHVSGIRTTPIYGGTAYDRQIRALKSGTQIVVGTPGRVIDFIERGLLRTETIQTLVFDEADEMLDMGFKDEIDRVVKVLPEDRQTIFFSATIAGPIQRLIENYTRDPQWVTIEHKALTVPTIEQQYYEVNARSKMEVLCRLLDIENPKLAIIFGNTKKTVDDITDTLMGQGYAIDRLHGDLNQTMRDRVMRNFRNGAVEVLAATDVAARGLDVDDVDLVVNFDLPYDEEDYVHRIGRTGRAGRKGKAVSLVSGRGVYLLQRIQRYAKTKIERHKVPTREEVQGKRADAFFETLRNSLEEGEYTRHEDTVQRLLDAGHTPTDIASALMHLWIHDSAREGQEILEDRPPGERRRERRERGDSRYDRRERREDRWEDRGPRRFDRDDRRGDRDRWQDRRGGERRFDREDRSEPNREAQPGYTRLFLNIGSQVGISPKEVAGALYRGCDLPQGSVGKIEIYSKCSFVQIRDEEVDTAMDRIGSTSLKGRTLRMDRAR